VLVASNLGWVFDGFEISALFLTVGFALHQLLVPTQYQAIARYIGIGRRTVPARDHGSAAAGHFAA
jgi:hypothetical protein